MTRYFAIAAAAAIIAIAGGTGIAVWFGRTAEDGFAQCRGSAIAGAGDIGGPFELVSETGETVTSESLLTEPSLIYFGYTFCPDVCPFDAARNADAVDLLEQQGREVQPVFISVDPARDTPDVLAEFTDYFHPRMIGLTGSEEQIDAAVRAYRAYYSIPDTDEDTYLVDHTAFTYLVLPGYGFVDFFRRDTPAEEMANRVACFLDAAS
ncbi:SCO family protein [Rhodobacterales bacterium HKCCE3408]|nr:SCO family protein [Rhodobacterales bacterium HKCCE3408]